MSEVQITTPFESVTVQGEQIALTSFKFGQLPAITKHIANITSSLHADAVDLPTLIAEGGEDILAILALAVGKPRAWFDTIEPDEGLQLLAAVIQLNSDMFVKKLQPVLSTLVSGLALKK